MGIEIKVPDIGTDEVEITEILVKVGDKVEYEQSLITIEGDKVSMEIPSPCSGTVQEIKINIGDKISTGSLIMIFTSTEVKSEQNPQLKEEINTLSSQTKKSEFSECDTYIHATPLVRRLAREFGINLAKIRSTGPKGRILREDLQSYVKDVLKSTNVVSNKNSNSKILDILPWPKVNFEKFGDIEEIELGHIQKISGANLSRNWVMIPHVTHFDKADITDLEKFRKQQNIESEQSNLGVKFTPLSFIIKAVSSALEQMPRFNSSLSTDGKLLILKKYVNIGVAVDTPNGLVVPVFKNVNKKSVTDLAKELLSLSKKAREGRLTPNEIQGGCFTISSIGGLGTTHFTPIVNAPEVAILGVSKSTIEPTWNGKKFIPRLMMPIALSFDHRVIDGADGVRFIAIIRKILSDIRRLVM